tara:strand:- start:396 stop:509 length:114 start_codon:yes stop_codon:yes gene_type:complete
MSTGEIFPAIAAAIGVVFFVGIATRVFLSPGQDNDRR